MEIGKGSSSSRPGSAAPRKRVEMQMKAIDFAKRKQENAEASGINIQQTALEHRMSLPLNEAREP